VSAGELHPPLFVLSCERSGSTLLRCLLDTHSDIAAPGELLLGDLCARWLLILERTLGQVEGGLGDGDDSAACVLAEVRRGAGGVMDRYCRAKGARLWCEKTPTNLNHADLLARVFPRARFLCLYRHGLDVALSCLEASRWGFMNEVAPFVAMSPENLPLAMTRSWMVKTATLLDFEARHVERCRRLRYEDLVEHPDERLGEVLDWLGLPREAGLVERAFTTAHDAGGGDPGFWRTRRVRGDRVGRGAVEIRQRLPAEVFPRLARLLEALGYPAPSTGGA
jgi:hypothetical protein